MAGDAEGIMRLVAVERIAAGMVVTARAFQNDHRGRLPPRALVPFCAGAHIAMALQLLVNGVASVEGIDDTALLAILLPRLASGLFLGEQERDQRIGNGRQRSEE